MLTIKVQTKNAGVKRDKMPILYFKFIKIKILDERKDDCK